MTKQELIDKLAETRKYRVRLNWDEFLVALQTAKAKERSRIVELINSEPPTAAEMIGSLILATLRDEKLAAAKAAVDLMIVNNAISIDDLKELL